MIRERLGKRRGKAVWRRQQLVPILGSRAVCDPQPKRPWIEDEGCFPRLMTDKMLMQSTMPPCVRRVRGGRWEKGTMGETLLVPSELLDRVVDYFHPRRIVLFGSRARGEAGSDSDIDLLVILDDDAPAAHLTLRSGWESRRGYERPVDVIPARESVLPPPGENRRHPGV